MSERGGKPQVIGQLLAVNVQVWSVKDLPSGDHRILLDALSKFQAGILNEQNFIAIHYEWIFANVLNFYKKQPLPEKTEAIRRVEMLVQNMPKSRKDDPNSEERELLTTWASWLDKENLVKRDNQTHLRWLRAMHKYFIFSQQNEKARITKELIMEHNNEVVWKEEENGKDRDYSEGQEVVVSDGGEERQNTLPL